MSPCRPWESEDAESLSSLSGRQAPSPHLRSRTQTRSADSATQRLGGGDAVRDAIRRFNAEVSILEILERHHGQGAFRRVASTNGGEWAGPCPLCGGEDRLRVWPTPHGQKPGAWCRQCGVSGDTLRWALLLSGEDPNERGATVRWLRENGLL